jgi:hypothetical protein
MKRLMVICEGSTEERFVKACLMDHLAGHGIDTSVSLLRSRPGQRGGGDVSLPRLANHIRNVYHNFDYVTTLIDYYGFSGQVGQTKTELERSILKAAAERLSSGASATRLLSYVQMHEFEALLFSDTSKFSLDDSWTDGQRQSLREIRAKFQTPEDINDSFHTAPSRRIDSVLPGYARQKTRYGPLIAEDIGLTKIRAECPGFNAWVTQLESLGGN